jgi:4,5-DOPA dioxygenase extradiol
MDRRGFLGRLGLFAALPFTEGMAMKIKDLAEEAKGPDTSDRMPALFMGHGSPMNGIEDNEFSARWAKLGQELPRPKAVLCVSAHWLTRGTQVTAMEHPPTIHDFGGFPRELFAVEYKAPGSPAFAEEIKEALPRHGVGLDHDWGLDHGTWSVVRRMYPEAKIPVLQLSIDYARPGRHHYELGKELARLRRKGYLIIGSGNMVHNLRMIAFDRINEPDYGYDWAHEINGVFKKHILAGDHDPLIEYERLGPAAKLAIPTPDHYYPLLYILGMQEKGETPSLFNDKAAGGSLTMTSVKFG